MSRGERCLPLRFLILDCFVLLASSVTPFLYIHRSGLVAMALAQQGPWAALLDRLAVHLDALKSDRSAELDRKARNKKFVRILEDVCTVVRDAERKAAPEFAEVVEKAHGMLNDALRYAYSQDSGFSSITSFAHSEDEPLVEDALEHAGAYISWRYDNTRQHRK